MTVSLALRDSHEVSEEKRKQIQKLAEKMGYRPNPLVSSLISYRRRPNRNDTNVVAIITKFGPPARQSPLFDEFYINLWEGIETRAQELGFRLEEFPVLGKPTLSAQALTRVLFTRGIRAVLLFPGGDLPLGYPHLDWTHFCAVACAFHDPGLGVHRVASDHAQAMAIALENIQKLGYSRPGLAMTTQLDPALRYAISGRFLSWQQGESATSRVPLINDANLPLKHSVFMQWYSENQPDIVLGLDPRVGAWIDEINRRHSSSVGFVHLSKKKNEPYAGVNLHTFDVGQASIDALARELYLNRYGLPPMPETILIAGTWEDGLSAPSR